MVEVTKVSVFTTRSRLRIATLSLKDETGIATAKWFGPQYIETRFKEGDTVAISGSPEVKKTGTVEFKNATIEIDWRLGAPILQRFASINPCA